MDARAATRSRGAGPRTACLEGLLWWVRAATVGAADSAREAQSISSMDELVLRAFRPIVPPTPPSSDTSGMLVGPGNLCIRWIVSQFRPMARRSPLESGRQRPKSVRNKSPWTSSSGLDISIIHLFISLYSVRIGGGLSRRLGNGCGVRTGKVIGVDKVIVAGPRCGKLAFVVGFSRAQRIVWWQAAAACANTSVCRKHDAQTAAHLPLGHSLGRRALAPTCVEVMNWRSALHLPTGPLPY